MLIINAYSKEQLYCRLDEIFYCAALKNEIRQGGVAKMASIFIRYHSLISQREYWGVGFSLHESRVKPALHVCHNDKLYFYELRQFALNKPPKMIRIN